MNNLDLRSAYLVVVVLYFFVPLATWLVLFHSRNRATQLWCMAGALVAVSTVLFGYPEPDPWKRWPYLLIANGLVLSAVYARIWALREVANRTFDWRGSLLLLMLISGVIGLSPFYIDWDHVKALLTLSHVGFYVCMSYEAWRVGLLLNIRSAYWISVLYVPVIALMLASVANSLMASMHVDFFNAGLINWGMVLMGALSSLGLHIGYVGIVMELRRRTEMRVLDEVLRGQIRTEHSQQIAHLQRQQLMGEVSSFMSHEVRQPLTAILSNAQLARHMLGQAQRAPADLDRIMGAIVQGVRRVDELMQRVARHVRAPVRHESEFSLADLVRDSVEMMQGIAHKRSVTLSVQGPSRHDVVKGDFIELSQILLNLIRNAIDACAQAQGGGQVILRLQHAQRRVVVSVEDNGPGFDAQALLQAGQSFYTTKPDGLGLGLSISRELATQNGAELSWRNGPDGALVQLSFPVRSMDDPVDDVGYTSKIPSE